MGELEKSQRLLAELAAKKFFGTVSFQMKGGAIVLIRQEATILPEDLPHPKGQTCYEFPANKR